MKREKLITTDRVRLAAAFDIWLDEYRKDPAAFAKLVDQHKGSYGKACAANLIRLLGSGR